MCFFKKHVVFLKKTKSLWLDLRFLGSLKLLGCLYIYSMIVPTIRLLDSAYVGAWDWHWQQLCTPVVLWSKVFQIHHPWPDHLIYIYIRYYKIFHPWPETFPSVWKNISYIYRIYIYRIYIYCIHIYVALVIILSRCPDLRFVESNMLTCCQVMANPTTTPRRLVDTVPHSTRILKGLNIPKPSVCIRKHVVLPHNFEMLYIFFNQCLWVFGVFGSIHLENSISKTVAYISLWRCNTDMEHHFFIGKSSTSNCPSHDNLRRISLILLIWGFQSHRAGYP